MWIKAQVKLENTVLLCQWDSGSLWLPIEVAMNNTKGTESLMQNCVHSDSKISQTPWAPGLQE